MTENYLKYFDDFIACGFLDNFEPKSMIHSEIYHFYYYCRKFKIKKIIESGTYLGFSAKRLAKLLPTSTIKTFEVNADVYLLAKKNLSGYETIETFNGKLEDFDLLNDLGEDTAIIIDGPKDMMAIKLAEHYAPLVKFVAMHDMFNHLKTVKRKFNLISHSSQDDFLTEEVKGLDSEIWKITNKEGWLKDYHTPLKKPFYFEGKKQKFYANVLTIVEK